MRHAILVPVLGAFFLLSACGGGSTPGTVPDAGATCGSLGESCCAGDSCTSGGCQSGRCGSSEPAR